MKFFALLLQEYVNIWSMQILIANKFAIFLCHWKLIQCISTVCPNHFHIIIWQKLKMLDIQCSSKSIFKNFKRFLSGKFLLHCHQINTSINIIFQLFGHVGNASTARQPIFRDRRVSLFLCAVEPRYHDTFRTRKKCRHRRSVAVTGVRETYV